MAKGERKKGCSATGDQQTRRIFMADFETTVYEGQTKTEVWAAALVELYHDDVQIYHSIDDFFTAIDMIEGNLVVYFHNLKFDGEFLVYYFVHDLGFTVALEGDDATGLHYKKNWKLWRNSVKASISDQGLWYTVTVKTAHHIIEFRDSYKLLPFSVKKLGKDFDTHHRKLQMEYTGYRYAGCQISNEEREYIANDVLVVKEALEAMFNEGHKLLTIGACCMAEFKKSNVYWHGLYNLWSTFFPDLYDRKLDARYGTRSNGSELTQGDYIRKAYRGGWCYVVPGKSKKVHREGLTVDVNSLYPSMMHSISGNYYPISDPHFFVGELPEEYYKLKHGYYFVRFSCRFKIKDGMLPFIQIKGNPLFIGKQSLETSDVIDKVSGNVIRDPVTLTMTCTDFELMMEHYHVYDLQILDGCYFDAEIGLFDVYINKYMKLKQESTGSRKAIAKLLQNNLYGKFSTTPDSSFKYPYVSESDVIMYRRVPEYEKTPGYIPIGAAITSYARRFTIKAAQANYYGPDSPGFIYADTDSMHISGLKPEEVKGIEIDSKAYCCWKIESAWDNGYFARQKTYIEHVTHEDGKPVDPYLNIKCAGMPDRCKDLLKLSLEGGADPAGHEVDGELIPWTDEEMEFLFTSAGEPILRTYHDFDIGLQVPGKLRPKRMPGGIVLEDCWFTMRA